jgi:choline-sulfatase
MTGRHPHRLGVWDAGVPLASDLPTWAQLLSRAGCETALSGKMHFVGTDSKHGFQHRPYEEPVYRIRSVRDWTQPITAAREAARRKQVGETEFGALKRFREAGPGASRHQDFDLGVEEAAVRFLEDPARREQPWALCARPSSRHIAH